MASRLMANFPSSWNAPLTTKTLANGQQTVSFRSVTLLFARMCGDDSIPKAHGVSFATIQMTVTTPSNGSASRLGREESVRSGTSYPGGMQHALALSNPPYLKAWSRPTRLGCGTLAFATTEHLRCAGSIGSSTCWRRRQSRPTKPGTHDVLVRLGEQVREYAKNAVPARHESFEAGSRIRRLARRGDVTRRLRRFLEELRNRRGRARSRVQRHPRLSPGRLVRLWDRRTSTT